MQTFKINDIDYSCEFILKNADDQEISFTKSAIRGMTLVDDVFSPFYEGQISIANPYDFIEEEYLLRGDGRDELSIKFFPVDNPENVFEQKYVIIDDSNSGNINVRSENIKTFHLLDKNAVPFIDKVPYSKSYQGKVGAILKDIFTELLGEELIDKDNWEDGDFEVSYIPPVTFRYMDLMNYFLRLFFGKAGDLHVKGLLGFNHKVGKYQLVLISKIFEDNKKNLMEAFALGDLTSEVNTSNPNNPPAEAPTGEYIGPMKNLSYSTPLYNWNSNFFTNALVNGYDPILGEHKIRKISIDDVKKKWSSKFVDVFKSVAGKPKPFLVTNKTTTERFKYYNMPYPVEDTVKLVESELYNSLTFYNLQCAFSNIGDTLRKAGMFIDIYKTNEDVLKSDEKILGRWFVTSIKHNFFADLYNNEFVCCKTYVGPNSNIKIDAK